LITLSSTSIHVTCGKEAETKKSGGGGERERKGGREGEKDEEGKRKTERRSVHSWGVDQMESQWGVSCTGWVWVWGRGRETSKKYTSLFKVKGCSPVWQRSWHWSKPERKIVNGTRIM